MTRALAAASLVAITAVMAVSSLGAGTIAAGCTRGADGAAGENPGVPTLPAWTGSERAQVEALTRGYTHDVAAGGLVPGVAPPLVGKPLPRTRFLTSKGEVIDIRERARRGNGRVLLVILRGDPRKVCIYCSSQTLALHDAAARFDAIGAEVVLVYPGEAMALPVFVEAVEALREGLSLAHPVVFDLDLALVEALGIEKSLARPTSLVVDSDGIVRYAYVGEDYKDRPSVAQLLEEIARRAR